MANRLKVCGLALAEELLESPLSSNIEASLDEKLNRGLRKNHRSHISPFGYDTHGGKGVALNSKEVLAHLGVLGNLGGCLRDVTGHELGLVGFVVDYDDSSENGVVL